MNPTYRDVIAHVAQNQEPLTNLEIWNKACAHNDQKTCMELIASKCVNAEEVPDIERTNALIYSRQQEMAMWASSNSGALADARIYMINNSSIPLIKKWKIDVVPGTHFCQMITKVCATAIAEKREELQEIQRQKQEEANRKQQRDFAEYNRRLKAQAAERNYHSREAVDQRNAVTRAAYAEKCEVYLRKVALEEALDEIYYLAHAPGDQILRIHEEFPFQRRSKVEKDVFAKTQQPTEPYYEKYYEEHNGLYITKSKYPLQSGQLFHQLPYQLPIALPTRPIQFHEQPLEVFEKLYRVDRRSHLERFDRALTALNKDIGLIRNELYFKQMKITLQGRPFLVSDILFDPKHPHHQFTPLRRELEAHDADNQAERAAKEAKLRSEVEQRNERRLKARQDDAARFKELQDLEKVILDQFTEEKKQINTYKIIRDHNDKRAVELFKWLYKSERRSFLGKMHEQINRIGTFDEIEEYACSNDDYMESKSRRLLREFKSLFDALRFSPIRMDFTAVSSDDITVKPISTFEQPAEAHAYGEWYRERCPKPRSDAAWIADFSTAYLQHTQERMIPVPFDRLKYWILNGSIFSFKQLKSYAEAHPSSEGANILKTGLKDRLSELNAADQAFKELKFQSASYTHPEMKKARQVYTESFYRDRLGVENIYDFTDLRTETYSPNERRSGDHLVVSRQLKAALLAEERALYDHFLSTND